MTQDGRHTEPRIILPISRLFALTRNQLSEPETSKLQAFEVSLQGTELAELIDRRVREFLSKDGPRHTRIAPA